MKRIDGRKEDQLRPLKIERDYMRHAEGSCLIEIGNTKVICAATVEKNVPLFLRGSGTGWVKAEYGMLPRCTPNRILRDKISGRTMEIQRLIGRSLRNVVRLDKLGEKTIWIDCDVIQADGGTRTASIVGGFVALVDCLNGLHKAGEIESVCITDLVGAISVGLHQGKALLDLSFQEDSIADVDMNVVMRACGEFIEVQGTGEKKAFSQDDLKTLLSLAKKGIEEIFDIQRNLFKDILPNL